MSRANQQIWVLILECRCGSGGEPPTRFFRVVEHPL